ncbi:MAG: glycosyltransferase, partial [Bacteroidetes bacterium]|nr:glycosyltransferase [Bacteroidota bacterium]
RLHNLAGDKPLVMAEIGLDSLRNGTEQQAQTLDWQVKMIFGGGCAGMFVFSWTDEWWRGGSEIEDWDFGLVDRRRNPKPALGAVSTRMQQLPVANCPDELPFISVVICSYNGSGTIRDSLNSLATINYPSYEVLVIDDGSTDNLAEIVSDYPVTLVSTPNRGLSNARNTGLYHARGEIIAYLDDDAYPELDWLNYLAWAYQNSEHAAIGGPNLCPEEDGPLAQCVANAPGGPVHVLLSDEVAEHIPGCNMSFRRSELLAIGGFDPIFRTAGDDVDVCWRIQQNGKTIGYHPSAQVWHHRRSSIKAYWKQQIGYGKAEALLEAKWPEKYNSLGHLRWAGRIYGNGITLPLNLKKDRVFHGTWGTALFQSVYQPAQGLLSALPLMPEWYMLSALFAVIGLGGLIWAPLAWSWLLFAGTLTLVAILGYRSACKAASDSPYRVLNRTSYRLIITFLHITQPIARLRGRLQHGLTPWRIRGVHMKRSFLFKIRPQTFSHWSETWRANEEWLTDIEKNLQALVIRVKRGGDFDEWDLQTRNGNFSSFRALAAVEEYGGGKQYVHLKVWRKPTATFLFSGSLLLLLSVLGFLEGYPLIGAIFGLFTGAMGLRYLKESAITLTAFQASMQALTETEVSSPQVERPTENTPAAVAREVLIFED